MYSFSTPLTVLREATYSLYVHNFLSAVNSDFKNKSGGSTFVIKPENIVQGVNERGPVDYAIESSNGVTVRVTEVKREDFRKGVTQNAVQIESILAKKRKRNPDDIDGTDTDTDVRTRCFGIVTNAIQWMFLECTCDTNDRPKFKLSRLYLVAFGQ